MHAFSLLVYLSGIYPLVRAGWAVRPTSLAHAWIWAAIAWLTWGLVLALAPAADAATLHAGRYLGLCLIGCAGVAVLGARRPGVAAWNFVVLGLLAVLLLAWAEELLIGSDVRLGGIRAVFLAGTLTVAILNYLPTRLAVAALLVAGGCALEMWALLEPTMAAAWEERLPWTALCFGLAPWAGWAACRWQATPTAEVDRLWREFRDRYGLVWGQRLREQFNRAAANAGWPIELSWHGLRASAGASSITPELQSVSLETLQALLKRFGLHFDRTDRGVVGEITGESAADHQ
jgi:hypothetical protein